MPLGPIHLIERDTQAGAGAVYYCGAEDAIAAIHPNRMSSFPREMLCQRCLEKYEEATTTNSAS